MITDYDVLAVGVGPFNLGLAALAEQIDDVRLVALETQPELCWHRGLMFDDAVLQVPFLADLVSLVDPTHKFSFLAYLAAADRLYPFYVREQFHPSRLEYESYLRWVASNLTDVRFGHKVDTVHWAAESERFVVHVARTDGSRTRFTARHLALGVGTEPCIPEALCGLPVGLLMHSGDYLFRSADIDEAANITVVGSGQSGAEVVLDLLRRNATRSTAVNWLTRTETFAPLDYSKLVLEMTTPDYVEFFHSLPEWKRDELRRKQWRHYRGISNETLNAIHDLLYARELRMGLAPVELRTAVEVESSAVDRDGRAVLSIRHTETGTLLKCTTDMVVSATGYRERSLSFLDPIRAFLELDEHGRPVVDADHSLRLDRQVSGRIYVSNADTHSHGVAAPDLGYGAVRNAKILNSITGRTCYRVPKHTAYTSFAIPGAHR